MKIAVLGSAPSSLQKAPFVNSQWAAYTQGKSPSQAVAHGQIPGDWDVWACSPGCWAVAPRASRWFEVHRWEPGQPWFTPEYCQFLRDFKGPVYTGGIVPEIPNHVVYPIDRIEEKFSSYFLTSSLALMLALAIDEIDMIRKARAFIKQEAERLKYAKQTMDIRLHPGAVNFALPMPEQVRAKAKGMLSHYIPEDELDKPDSDDMIGLWGVDMAAAEEYGYQRPGCHFFVLEAFRRGIAVYIPPESDLMRPQPVYGISEWYHNYIKMTAHSKHLAGLQQHHQQILAESTERLRVIAGEQSALDGFVKTWTSPYGMEHGVVMRQEPGTGLGGGVTHLDTRPPNLRIPPPPSALGAALDAEVDLALRHAEPGAVKKSKKAKRKKR